MPPRDASRLFLPIPFELARKAFLLRIVKDRYTTAKALAKELGCTPATLSQVMAGDCRSARIEARLADMAGIPAEVLFPSKEKAA
jgi:transcriptional regulator with XRE-family HTH domain